MAVGPLLFSLAQVLGAVSLNASTRSRRFHSGLPVRWPTTRARCRSGSLRPITLGSSSLTPVAKSSSCVATRLIANQAVNSA